MLLARHVIFVAVFLDGQFICLSFDAALAGAP